MTTTYKLTYFNWRGLGETARYIFAAAGKDYTDVRFTSKEDKDWLAYQPTTPFGQAPTLEVTVDGKSSLFGQSSAINKFLSLEFGYMGNNKMEAFLIDSVYETLNDLLYVWADVVFQKPEKDRPGLKKWFDEVTVPAVLKKLDAIWGKTKGPYLLGDRLSLADIYFARSVDEVDMDGSVTKQLPNMQKGRDATDVLFKAWRTSRPQTPL